MASQDELTATVFDTIQSLSSTRKAGRRFFAHPVPRNDVVRALLVQGNARKAGGENLIAKAEQGAFFCAQTQAGTHILSDFRAVLKLLKWIGYPGTQMRAEVVQTVLATHPHLHGLGL